MAERRGPRRVIRGTLDDLEPLTGGLDDFAAEPTSEPPPESGGVLDTLGDVGIGALKGGVGAVVALGNLVHQVPGVSRLVDALYGTPGLSRQAFTEAQQAVTPTNTAQSVGQVVADLAMSLAPSGAITRGGTALASRVAPHLAPIVGQTAANLIPRAAVEAGAGGLLSGMQGGDIGTGAVLSGAMPVVGAGLTGAANRVLRTVGGQRLAPLERETVELADRLNIPLDAATRSGRPFVQRLQKRVGEALGGAGKAEEFQAGQRAALEREARTLAERVRPGAPVSREAAGAAVMKRLNERISELDAIADRAYTRLREIEADPANLHKVTMRVPMTDSAGVTRLERVTVEMPLPVDLRSVKRALGPIYERMQRQLPTTVKDASPGFTAIRNIMQGYDYMPASIVDADLSVIKKLARGADLPALRSYSQGLAAKVVSELEDAVQAAVAKAGPEATAARMAGAKATTQKHVTAAARQPLARTEEPVAVVRRLVQPGDASINLLRRVAVEAPESIPDLARAVIDDLMESASASGKFAPSAKLWTDWNKIGPQTKAVLFQGNRELVKDLDRFFLLMKRISENPNPSGTAGTLTTATLRSVAAAVPMRALAQLLFTPGGARALTEGIQAGQPNVILDALRRTGAVQASQIGGASP